MVVVTVTGALFSAIAPAEAPATVNGAVVPPPKAVNINPPADKVIPFVLDTVTVAVVLLPVADERNDCEAPRDNAVVKPVTSNVAPLAIIICGELEILPAPDNANVPAEIVVLPVNVFDADNVKTPDPSPVFVRFLFPDKSAIGAAIVIPPVPSMVIMFSVELPSMIVIPALPLLSVSKPDPLLRSIVFAIEFIVVP